MRMSARGLAALSVSEGLVTHPYEDSVGHCTIGVGHLIHFGPCTSVDRDRYRDFDRAAAIRLLRQDVRERERAVEQLVEVRLNQNQFDALVSFVFNVGAGDRGFAGSTVRRRLNAHDYRGAADALLMWDIPPEIIDRRRRERALFLEPVPDPLRPLGRLQRRAASRLLHHRRGALRAGESSAHARYRGRWRRVVVRLARRERRADRRRVFARVLRDRDGRL